MNPLLRFLLKPSFERLLRIDPESKPAVYIEVFDRVSSKTLTGRLCKPLSTRFLVQWPEQQELYPGSVLIGSLYP